MEPLEPQPSTSDLEKAESTLRTLNDLRVECISAIQGNPYSAVTLADFFNDRAELNALIHEFPASLRSLLSDFKDVYYGSRKEIFKSLVSPEQSSDLSTAGSLQKNHPARHYDLTPESYDGIKDYYSAMNDAAEIRAVALWLRLKLNADPLPILWWLLIKAYARECVRVGLPIPESMQLLRESTFREQVKTELHDEALRNNRAKNELYRRFGISEEAEVESEEPLGDQLAKELGDEIMIQRTQEELRVMAPRLREVFHAILNEGSTSVSLELK